MAFRDRSIRRPGDGRCPSLARKRLGVYRFVSLGEKSANRRSAFKDRDVGLEEARRNLSRGDAPLHYAS